MAMNTQPVPNLVASRAAMAGPAMRDPVITDVPSDTTLASWSAGTSSVRRVLRAGLLNAIRVPEISVSR